MRVRIVAALAAACLGVTAALAGCTSTVEPSPSATPTPVVTATEPGPTVEPSPTQEQSHDSTIAMSRAKEIAVSETPGGPTSQTIKAEDVLTVPDETPLVFLVKTIETDAVEVYLPVRPNGSTGWVDRAAVDLYSTDFAIDVYLAQHELTVSQDGVVVATYPIGTGQDELPTPGGVYFLRELLAPPNPNGPYGPYAYGLSGFSPVLDNFKGGDAVIGIHGTNEPDSIGGNVSHGCIRLNNDDITALVQTWQLPLGAPVYIHA